MGHRIECSRKAAIARLELFFSSRNIQCNVPTQIIAYLYSGTTTGVIVPQTLFLSVVYLK
jgi:hypothetical protein